MSKIDEYDKTLLEILCKKACKFYKPDQEEKEEDFRCGAYLVIKKMLKQGEISKQELQEIYQNIPKKETNKK
ncbi:MAG: hypothetical protein ACUVXA_06650 [Candidatus Jordarchaeum sp.]|uniref:hypothetical protein n=1 Tax=Candidatus Jordarchaeum sp. TaxID=2823881 RepID=UPI00404B96D4